MADVSWLMETFACLHVAFLSYVMAILLFGAIPAALGYSFGLRSFYIKFLLKIFEYGRNRMASKNMINENGLIAKDDDGPPKSPIPRNRSFGTLQRDFDMADAMDFMKSGFEAIIDDEVTKRFSAQELASWNLLTRTNENYHYLSARLSVMWVLGFFFRYFILFPLRLTLMMMGLGFMFSSTFILSLFPKTKTRVKIDEICTLVSFRILTRSVSGVVTFHNRENMAKGGGTCVANHTSPIDAMILANDRCYSLVGQIQPGLFGMVERALARTQDHIWFERSAIKDRLIVTRRLKEHVEDLSKNPILIFPEGTCINNTSVMMFKKGSFEIGGVIYPVAIKYDRTFGDAFWNSSQESMGQYLLMLMTSWALVCHVWYLPPMTRKENESAVAFANRVKREIALQGGLVDLIWDGQLKRTRVKPELKQKKQEDYAQGLKLE